MSKDFLPDWLPAVVVRDWRQVLRSPLYLLGVLAMLLLGGAGAVPDGSDPGVFMMMMRLLVCLLVPVRVGMLTEAEARAQGGCFIRLTRLGAWRVVWGMWLSGALQVLLLAAVLFGGMLLLRPAGALRPSDWLPFVLVVSQGWLLVALCQAFYAAGGAVRVGCFLVALFGVGVEGLWLGEELRHFPDAATCGWPLLGLLLVHGVMLLTFLAEARRPYLHPAEQCSVAVRWLSLLAFALPAGGMLCGAESVFCGRMATWACVFVLTMACWGLVHPVHSVDGGLVHGARRGLWGGALWLVAAVGLCAVVESTFLLGQHGEVLAAAWLLYGYFWLGLAVCLLVPGLVCQVARRMAPMLFVLLLLVEYTACGLVLAQGAMGYDVSWWELLPLPPLGLEAMMGAAALPAPPPESLLPLLGVKLLWLALLLGGFFALSRRSRL